jgi:CheY-like chemotaxis protein
MHVLLVEDSDEVRDIAVEYLTELGHESSAVPDAEQALARLLEHSCDAVMTDVSLPGMSGIALAKALVDKYPQLPVVISSGYGGLDLDVLFRDKRNHVFVLPKPYDLTALEQVLSAAAALKPSEK